MSKIKRIYESVMLWVLPVVYFGTLVFGNLKESWKKSKAVKNEITWNGENTDEVIAFISHDLESQAKISAFFFDYENTIKLSIDGVGIHLIVLDIQVGTKLIRRDGYYGLLVQKEVLAPEGEGVAQCN